MTTEATRLLDAVDGWTVPPVRQGQIVEYAYGGAWEAERMVRRITDRSDGTVRYEVAPAPDTWEPWQTEPVSAAWMDLR